MELGLFTGPRVIPSPQPTFCHPSLRLAVVWSLNSFFNTVFIYFLGCAGSSWLHGFFSSCSRAGATLWMRCVASSRLWLPLTASTVAGALGLHQLWLVGAGAAAPRLWSTGLVVAAHGLSCPVVCGIFPNQGSNPCLLHWLSGFSSTEPPGETLES